MAEQSYSDTIDGALWGIWIDVKLQGRTPVKAITSSGEQVDVWFIGTPNEVLKESDRLVHQTRKIPTIFKNITAQY